MNGYFAQAIGTDPCVNLAMEEYLVRLNEGLRSVILYLWQNEDTVVIGRNQNAYNECSLKYAEENGIRIVRRLTGGGAVFHDTGNINYSVITTASEHDITRSTQVIIVALQSLGIDAKADVSVYDIDVKDFDTTLMKNSEKIEKQLLNSKYTIKDGKILVKDSKIIKLVNSRHVWCNIEGLHEREEKLIKRIKPEFNKYYTIKYENYPVPDHYLEEEARVQIKYDGD